MSNLTQLITKPLTKNDLENVVNYLKGSSHVVDHLKGKKNKEVKLDYDDIKCIRGIRGDIAYFSIKIGKDRIITGHSSILDEEMLEQYPLLKERYTNFYMYADKLGKSIMKELAFVFGGYWNPSEHEIQRGEFKETFFEFEN